MFSGKAGAYPRGAPFRCSTLGFRLARLAIYKKNSSLFQILADYGGKIFYNFGHWEKKSLSGEN
jgi:hypothetical protein